MSERQTIDPSALSHRIDRRADRAFGLAGDARAGPADALGVRCHSHLIEVAGADREALRDLLDGVRRLGFAGVNVTFPYKEAVVDLLDELSPSGVAVGAVNAVAVRDNRLIGHNNRHYGLCRAIRLWSRTPRREPSRSSGPAVSVKPLRCLGRS